jgi:hypothetical protein
MPEYFQKTVPIGTTGISASCWAIAAGTFQLGGSDGPVYGVTVLGYVDAAAYSAGFQAVPSASLPYSLTVANFPPGTDPNSMSLNLLYQGVLNVANSNPDDPLNGAVLVNT